MYAFATKLNKKKIIEIKTYKYMRRVRRVSEYYISPERITAL